MSLAQRLIEAKALEILQHALGLDHFGKGRDGWTLDNTHRRHFVASAGHSDFDSLLRLVELGHMTRQAGNEITGGADLFLVTDAGREFVRENSPKPPKLTRSQRRYRAWVAADCGIPYGEWIRGHWGRSI